MKPSVRSLPVVLMAASLLIARPRIIVETDLGGDADDQASLVRFLLYTNEVDVKGIVLSRSNSDFQSDGAAENPSGATTTLEMAHDYLDAYGSILSNLRVHDPDYPSVDYLTSITVSGHADGGNAGRDLIIDELKQSDSRLLWYTNWGCNDGSESSLKKALDDIQSGGVSGLSYGDVMARMPYVEVYLQNHIGSAHRSNLDFYMDTFFPDMDGGRWYHKFNDIVGIESWLHSNANSTLCDDYYTTDKEGDTPTFLHILPNGINIAGKPWRGSWAGRYGWNSDYDMWWCDRQDTWNGTTNRDNTMRRFETAIENDFKVRAKWCDYSSWDAGNHHPIASINGDEGFDPLVVPAAAGETVTLDASGSSDPDGDNLDYSWVYYGEISSGATPDLGSPAGSSTTVTLPGEFSAGDTIHLYLEVTDDGGIPLTRYKRVLLVYTEEGSTPVVSSPLPRSSREILPFVYHIAQGHLHLTGLEFDPPMSFELYNVQGKRLSFFRGVPVDEKLSFPLPAGQMVILRYRSTRTSGAVAIRG